MSQALARAFNEPTVPPAVVMAASGGSDGDMTEETLRAEALAGVERLRQMAHEELRQVITQRVNMLQNAPKDRGPRRKVLDES